MSKTPHSTPPESCSSDHRACRSPRGPAPLAAPTAAIPTAELPKTIRSAQSSTSILRSVSRTARPIHKLSRPRDRHIRLNRFHELRSENWPRTKSGGSERSMAVSQSSSLARNSQTRRLADSSFQAVRYGVPATRTDYAPCPGRCFEFREARSPIRAGQGGSDGEHDYHSEARAGSGIVQARNGGGPSQQPKFRARPILSHAWPKNWPRMGDSSPRGL